ncbi:MAG: hypothetical protein Q8936_17820 [Bacillota bacterium]|nr:hypothetical protein [Bacillota bacterium]
MGEQKKLDIEKLKQFDENYTISNPANAKKILEFAAINLDCVERMITAYLNYKKKVLSSDDIEKLRGSEEGFKEISRRVRELEALIYE